MTTREAINEILVNINEIPLDDSDLTTDINIAVIANKFLDVARKQTLHYGWNFNTMKLSLYPNTSNYIVIPTTYLSVDGANDSDDYIVRDYKLFDKTTQSFNFEEGVECIVVDDVVFDDIPFGVANYIVKIASATTYANAIGDVAGMKVRSGLVADAKVEAFRDDANKIDGNVLTSVYATTLLDRTSI